MCNPKNDLLKASQSNCDCEKGEYKGLVVKAYIIIIVYSVKYKDVYYVTLYYRYMLRFSISHVLNTSNTYVKIRLFLDKNERRKN